MDEIETANEEGKYRTKENWLIRKVINENKNKNAEEIIVCCYISFRFLPTILWAFKNINFILLKILIVICF